MVIADAVRFAAHLAAQGAQSVGAALGPDPSAPAARRALGTPTLRALLDRALTQSTGSALDALAVAAVAVLVPDEARIVVALGQRGWSPVVQVEPRRDGEEHLALRNASLVGRQAGVALVSHTPLYVTRLLASGLVHLTGERSDAEADYEILLAEPDVLDAIKRIGRAPLGARVRRQGLALSALGERVWQDHRAEDAR